MIAWIKALSIARKINLFFLVLMGLVAMTGTVGMFLPGTVYKAAWATAAVLGGLGIGMFVLTDKQLKDDESKIVYNDFFAKVAQTYLYHFRPMFYGSNLGNEIERFEKAQSRALAEARRIHASQAPSGVAWYVVENDLYQQAHKELEACLNEVYLEVMRDIAKLDCFAPTSEEV